jgi:hypothetical protein
MYIQRMISIALIALTGLVIPVAPSRIANQTLQTISLNVDLSDSLSVNASVAVQTLTVANNQATITGSISGTAVINGDSATISSQPITLVVTATCKAGTGTLTLNTSQITLSLSNGLTATVAPATVTASATCGKTPTLTATTSPVQASISDGTFLSVSQCTVKLSSGASTTIGHTICNLSTLICKLFDAITNNGDIVSLLNQTLAELSFTIK